MSKAGLSRRVAESYYSSRADKVAYLQEPDVNALGLNPPDDFILVIGKRKASARWLVDRQGGTKQDEIRLGELMRNAADVSVGDTVTIEKVTPLAGHRVTLRPIEEIIPGVSTRVAEYIPFALKNDVLTIGERMWYSFDNMEFVFEVLDIQPADAILVSKDTKFVVKQSKTS